MNMLDTFRLMDAMPPEALEEWARQYDAMSAWLRERYAGPEGEARYQYEQLERERLRRNRSARDTSGAK